jgi:hypothetical protein
MKHALLVVALAGCGGTVVSSYIPIRASSPPRAPETVDVRLSGPPSRPVVDLGLIKIAETDVKLFGDSRLPEMIARLRSEGAAHGCDVVIGNPPQLQSARWLVTGTCAAYAPTNGE